MSDIIFTDRQTDRQRIYSLQVIRAFAFLGIFLSHSGVTAFSAGGSWGVSVFFILSGFLMFYSYNGTNRIKSHSIKYSIIFGVNKIKKLYYLHIATMLLAMPWLVKAYMDYQDNDKILTPIIKTVLNIFLLQSWIPSIGVYFSLNGVAWYLSVSLFLYIMFPYILHQMEKYKGKKTAIKLIIVLLFLQCIMAFFSYYIRMNLIHNIEVTRWFIYIFPISRLEDFLIGCNLGYIFKNSQNLLYSNNNNFYTFFEFGVITIIIIQMAVFVMMVAIPAKIDPTNTSPNWWGTTVLWTITSCALIYLFAIQNGKISNMLTNKIFVYLGNISANTFLIHQMVYRYLELFETKILDNKYEYTNIIMCFIITIASAYMWDYMVKLFQNKRRYKVVS